MSLSRCAVKTFSVALLILSMTVIASAQSVAELKKQAATGDAGSQPQVTEKTLSDADYKTFLLHVEEALPKWETALKNIDLERVPRISYANGKAIADYRDIGLMELGNIRLTVAKQRVKRTVSGELALSRFLEGLFDAGNSIVWMEDVNGLTLSSLEKYAPELGALLGRIGNDVSARVALLEKGACVTP